MRAATLSGAAVFFFVSSVLGMAEVRTKEHNARTLASAQEKMSATLPNNPSAPPPGPTGSTGATAAKPAPPTPAQGYTPAVGVQDPAKGFTGRYRLGPENAPIRIVMITDYQCPDCKHFEEQAMELVKKYPSVSLSTKHFPFCQQCNSTPNVPNLHPNACMAARAAEAAGIVYGPEGFWKMHRWLFDHSGYFQDATEFNASLRSLGFVPEEFHPVMMGAQAMANIQADITEANGLGLKSTPMMFVNGVTLDGWGADTFALKNAVEKLVAQSPQPAAPVADKPKNASQRRAEEAAAVIDQWRDTLKTPAMAWPDRKKAWTNVPDTVPLKISLWGDLLEPNCAIADKTIRDAIAGRGDIRYEFRSFPFDQTCNPELPRTMFPNGCKAAKAEEAAGQIAFAAARKRMQDWTIAHAAEVNHEALTQAAQQMGFDPDLFRTRLLGPGTGDMANRAADAAGFMAGTEAYWRVHVWIMEHQRDFSDASLRAAAPGLGLNADEWMQRMTQQDIAEIVAWDVNIGARIHIPEIPRVFVNGKVITRPLIEGQFVIERIIAEAEKMEEAKKLNAPK